MQPSIEMLDEVVFKGNSIRILDKKSVGVEIALLIEGCLWV